jgi:protein-S-isoprenylcysteine O-methyltransferase Ste14
MKRLFWNKYLSVLFTLSVFTMLGDICLPPTELPAIVNEDDNLASFPILAWIWSLSPTEQLGIVVLSTYLCTEVQNLFGEFALAFLGARVIDHNMTNGTKDCNSRENGKGGLSWSVMGSIIAMIGFSLRRWAKKELAEAFTYRISIPTNGLIDTGPYKYFLHPGYIGSLLHVCGLALQTFPDNIFLSKTIRLSVAFIIISCITVILLVRIKDEETMLFNHFGDTWITRERDTWPGRLIPGVF